MTPGPWKIIDNETEIEITDDEQQFGICTLRGAASESRKAMMANAHLIAAAPEMLGALYQLDKMYSDHSRTHFDLSDIRSILKSAIAKAERKEGV